MSDLPDDVAAEAPVEPNYGYGDRLTHARLAGHGWEDVDRYLNDGTNAAQAEGYTDHDIRDYLGLAPPEAPKFRMTADAANRVSSDPEFAAKLKSTAKPLAITPLEQMSAGRMADHGDLTMPTSILMPEDGAPLEPSGLDLNDEHMRTSYARSLLNNEVRSPRDFAEHYVGALGNAARADPGTAVRAAGELGSALPSDKDFTDQAIAIAHSSGVALDGDTVKTVRNNLIDHWMNTSQPLEDTYKQAYNDPELAQKLTTPPDDTISRLAEVFVGASAGMLDFWKGTNVGLRDVIGGATQLIAHSLPQPIVDTVNEWNNALSGAGLPLQPVPPGGIDQMEKERLAALETDEYRTGEWSRWMGQVGATLPMFTTLGQAGFWGSVIAGATQGAASAAFTPETAEDFWKAKAERVAEDTATGAVMGGVLHGALAGIGKAVAAMTPKAAEMLGRVVSGMDEPTVKVLNPDASGGVAGEIPASKSLEPTQPAKLAPPSVSLGDGELRPNGADGYVHYPLIQDGEKIGHANIEFLDGGKTASIENIEMVGGYEETDAGLAGSNKLGPKEVRGLARQFFLANPDVDTIVGLRVTGARGEPGAVDITRQQALRGMEEAPKPARPQVSLGERVDNGGEGSYRYPIERTGETQPIGHAEIVFNDADKPTSAHVENVYLNGGYAETDTASHFGSNQLGPREIRGLARQFFLDHPGVEDIGGFRTTGAREAAGAEADTVITRKQALRGMPEFAPEAKPAEKVEGLAREFIDNHAGISEELSARNGGEMPHPSDPDFFEKLAAGQDPATVELAKSHDATASIWSYMKALGADLMTDESGSVHLPVIPETLPARMHEPLEGREAPQIEREGMTIDHEAASGGKGGGGGTGNSSAKGIPPGDAGGFNWRDIFSLPEKRDRRAGYVKTRDYGREDITRERSRGEMLVAHFYDMADHWITTEKPASAAVSETSGLPVGIGAGGVSRRGQALLTQESSGGALTTTPGKGLVLSSPGRWQSTTAAASRDAKAQDATRKMVNLFRLLEPHMAEYKAELAKGINGNPMNTAVGEMIKYIEGRSSGAVMDPNHPLAPVADGIRYINRYVRKMLEDAHERGVINQDSYFEDYFRHMWKDPNKASLVFNDFLSRPGQLGSSAGLLHRTLPTFEDGIRRGLQPAIDNPLEMTLFDAAQKVKYIQSSEMLGAAKKDGVVNWRLAPQGDEVALNSHRTSFGIKDGKIMTAYANPGFANTWNDWLSKGFHQRPGVTSSLYDKFQYSLNTANGLALALPTYHFLAETVEASAGALGHAMSAAYGGHILEATKELALATPGISLARGTYSGGKYIQDYLKLNPNRAMQALVDAGFRFGKRQEIYKFGAAQSYETAIKRGQYINEIVSGLKGVLGSDKEPMAYRVSHAVPRYLSFATREFGRDMNFITGPMFDYMIPRLKAYNAVRKMELFLRDNTNATGEQIKLRASQISRNTDERLGEMNMDNTYWPKSIKQATQLAMISQGWVYGWVRQLAAAGQVNIEKMAFEKNPVAIQSLANFFAAYATVNSAYQYIKTGQAPWSTDTPIHDMLMPRTGGTNQWGTAERTFVPSHAKELFDYYKIGAAAMHSPGEGAKEGANYVTGKMKNIIQFLNGVRTGKDAIGHDIEHTAGGWGGFFAKSFMPIFESSLDDRKIGTNISPEETVMGFKPVTKAAQDPKAFFEGLDKMDRKLYKQEIGRAKYENKIYINKREIPVDPERGKSAPSTDPMKAFRDFRATQQQQAPGRPTAPSAPATDPMKAFRDFRAKQGK